MKFSNLHEKIKLTMEKFFWGSCLTTFTIPINPENKTDILAKLTLYYYLITSYKEHYTDKLMIWYFRDL